MAIEHVDIPDGERHEPKGADSAASGEVYIADGAGSGAWGTPSKIVYLNTTIADVSTASSVLLPLPADCTVNGIKTILEGTIATADATVTLSRGGDSAVLGTVTVPFSGSAEGDVNSNISLSNNTVAENTHNYLKVATDGASTNAVALFIQIEITI